MKTVHRCKFVDLSLGPITAIAVTPSTVKCPMVACARQSGCIEIYSIVGDEVILNRKLPGVKGNNINKLAWTHQTIPSEYSELSSNAIETEQLISSPPRLFSVGLTGLLIEWDLVSLRPKRYSESYGGGIWCLAIHPSHTSLAIGCEDGGIRIFSIKDDFLELEKKLPQKPRRVLSLAWFPDGKHLVAGTDFTTIEKWDATLGNQPITKPPLTILGKIVATMKVEHGRKWANTYIWGLIVVGDKLIVSGDSKGNVTLFEGGFGTMVTTFRCHEVDVLCLAANKEGTEFYSAGVDNKLVRYINSSVGLVSDWTVQSHRRHHHHDTLALGLYQNHDKGFLFSGGLDMRLSSIDVRNFTFAPFYWKDGFPSPPPIHLAPSHRILMASYPDKLKFWKLGSITKSDTRLIDTTPLQLDSDYSEQLTILTESNQNILCSGLSNDAQWVAFSDVTSIRLFEISWSNDSSTLPILNQVNNFPPPEFYQLNLPFKFAKEMVFVKKELVIATVDGRILAFNLLNSKVRLVSIPFPNLNQKGFTINHLSTDIGEKLVSVSHSGNGTVVLDLVSGNPIYSLHGQSNVISTLLVGSPAKLAVVNRNWETNLFDLTINDKSATECLKCTFKNQKVPLACSAPQGNGLVIYDSNHMVFLRPNSTEITKVQPHPYNEIMFLGFLSQGELVIVERPYSDLMSELPPAFASKLYTGQRNKKLVS